MGVSAGGIGEFLEGVGPRLRLALVASYGPEVGPEAAAEAVAWGWEHRRRLPKLDNPAGYLYRVGQTHARRLIRIRKRTLGSGLFPPPADHSEPVVEPGLPAALQDLSDKQRVAVLLAHGYGFTLREVAGLLGVSPSTVQKNAERGLAHLRESLGVAHVS